MTQDEKIYKEAAKALIGYYSWHMDELLELYNAMGQTHEKDLSKLHLKIDLEQHVTTLDADEKDPFSLFLWAECEGQTVGFLRMIPRGIAYAEPSIGRVCVARTYRRRGICREMGKYLPFSPIYPDR